MGLSGPNPRALKRFLGTPMSVRYSTTAMMIKRLEVDRFCWPKDAPVVTLTVEQLHWLLAGIDLAAMRPHPLRIYTKVS